MENAAYDRDASRHAAGMTLLPDFGVHKKPEPESLKHPEDEACGAIQKSETQEIPIEKKKKWADEEWRAIILLTQEALLLDRVSPRIRADASSCFRGFELCYLAV